MLGSSEKKGFGIEGYRMPNPSLAALFKPQTFKI